MLDVNKKILWLADYDLSEAPGGAQRSDQMIISQGKILGYKILKVINSSFPSDLNIDEFDVLITSNLHALSTKHKDLIDKISKHKYHIRLEHDSNQYLTQEDRIKLFGNCVKTIFLSDFHYSFFKHFYGDIFKNVEIIYDPIDTNNFRDLNNKREDKILYAGYLHQLKGSYEFFDYALQNKNQQFVVAGWCSNHIFNHLLTTVPNIEYLGCIDHNQMPLIYNKYKYMFYNPNLNEPFCRSVAEAVLCGTNILTYSENRIGCLSEIKKVGIDNFREKCSKAGLKFWEIL